MTISPHVADCLARFNWSLQYSSRRKESADKAIIQVSYGGEGGEWAATADTSHDRTSTFLALR